jgi:poly-gamma-glutamate capsule biosynthesis protein CapA/YwtB (metallophosphatase superfamily)
MDSIKLFLSGDVMTGRGIDQLLPWPCEPVLYESYLTSARDYVALAERANGPVPRSVDILYPWGDAAAELARQQPDLRIINLETSVTRHGEPALKGINYRMSPENFCCISKARIDCCVLANNHVLDWEEPGLIETLDTIAKSTIIVAGAGRNIAEATAPAILPLSGRRRVIVYAGALDDCGVPRGWCAGIDRPGVNLLPDLSTATLGRIRTEIETVRQAGDVVIASLHWGGNWGYAVPSSHSDLAHALIDEAGIDLVHGHSSHHAKAIEVHHGRLILYGCGDFITDYEGITGYEAFRDDLVLMYLPELARDGRLHALTMVPFQLRKLRLNHALEADVAWLRDVLDRECRRFNGAVAMNDTGSLRLDWH